MKIKNFSNSKYTIKKVKRQPTELEEIFVNHMSDKKLASRICKEFLELDNRRQPN